MKKILSLVSIAVFVSGLGACSPTEPEEPVEPDVEEVLEPMSVEGGIFVDPNEVAITSVRDVCVPKGDNSQVYDAADPNDPQQQKKPVNFSRRDAWKHNFPMSCGGRIKNMPSGTDSLSQPVTAFVPWGNTDDWNLVVSPEVFGYYEGRTWSDNAFLYYKLEIKTLSNKSGWEIRVQNTNRNSDNGSLSTSKPVSLRVIEVAR